MTLLATLGWVGGGQRWQSLSHSLAWPGQVAELCRVSTQRWWTLRAQSSGSFLLVSRKAMLGLQRQP